MISVRLRAVLLFSLVVGGSTAVFAISSIDFTVSQAYASTPDAATFDFPGSFAIEAWFQSNGPHDGALVSKFWQNSGSPLDDSYYLCLRTADTVQARIQTTLQLADLRAAGPIHDGEWHHVVLVFDTAAHVAELYLDGELKAWQTLLGTLRNTNESVRLGAVLDGGGLGSFLDGRLDELRFWNTARRGKQAWCLKDVTLLTGTPGLTSYYRFDEGSGSTTADLIPPYETFSLISGTVFSPVEPPLLSRLSGPGQCRCGTIAGVFTPAVPSVTLVGDTIRVLSGDSLILESHALTLDSTVTQLRIEGRFRCAGTMSDSSWVLAQGSPAAAGIVALVGSQPVTLNYTRVSGFAADAIQATTPITAEHCLFSANPGRALVTSSTATIRDSRFEGNGLAVQASGGNVTISSCNFAGDGGGLDVTGANLTVDSSDFADFVKPAGRGAAVNLTLNTLTRAAFTSCNFTNNRASGGAGGVISARGNLYPGASGDSLILRNCTFRGNSADSGGAVWGENVNLRWESCAFDSNLADGMAGAVMVTTTGGGVSHLHGDSLSFTNNEGGGASALLLKGVNSISPVEARVINCTFAGNVRSLSGEGPALRGSAVQQISGAGPVLQRCLFHDNSNAGGAASAILLENSAGTTVELRNLTAVLNQADSAAIRLNAPAILRNSIVIENGGARQIGGTNPAVAYCLTSDTQYHGAGGSFYADPAFEDFWERDYRLSAGSFAINRGDPNQAYNDPDGTRADVGAFVAESFSAEIESLFDVPHDNGRQLMLEWLPSAGDDARQGIVSYLIYRKVNLAILENFELVATVPAARLEGYGRIVPTLADSNASGIRYYSFFVRAQSVNPLAYWDTPQDSGYSVDNLTPATPQQLAGMEIAVGAQLTWEAVPDTDVAYYAVYRGAVPFDPDTASAVYGTSAEPVFVDSMETGSFFYAVRAVDRNGNRSQPSGVVAVEVGIVHPPLALTIAVEESQLRLRWQSSPGAVQYRIFRSLQADGPMDYVDSTSDTMYVITDIPIRAFYFVTAER